MHLLQNFCIQKSKCRSITSLVPSQVKILLEARTTNGIGVGIVEDSGVNVKNIAKGDYVLLSEAYNGSSTSLFVDNDAVIKFPPNSSANVLMPNHLTMIPDMLSATIILNNIPCHPLKDKDVVLIAPGVPSNLVFALKDLGIRKGLEVLTDKDIGAARGAKIAISSIAGKATTDVVRRLGPAGMLIMISGAEQQSSSVSSSSSESNEISFPIAKAIFTDVSVHGFKLETWIKAYPEKTTQALDAVCSVLK